MKRDFKKCKETGVKYLLVLNKFTVCFSIAGPERRELKKRGKVHVYQPRFIADSTSAWGKLKTAFC